MNEPGWRVNVAESNDGDVGVGAFSDGLMISSGVGNDQQTGLAESCLDLIGECT